MNLTLSDNLLSNLQKFGIRDKHGYYMPETSYQNSATQTNVYKWKDIPLSEDSILSLVIEQSFDDFIVSYSDDEDVFVNKHCQTFDYVLGYVKSYNKKRYNNLYIKK